MRTNRSARKGNGFRTFSVNYSHAVVLVPLLVLFKSTKNTKRKRDILEPISAELITLLVVVIGVVALPRQTRPSKKTRKYWLKTC